MSEEVVVGRVGAELGGESCWGFGSELGWGAAGEEWFGDVDGHPGQRAVLVDRVGDGLGFVGEVIEDERVGLAFRVSEIDVHHACGSCADDGSEGG